MKPFGVVAKNGRGEMYDSNVVRSDDEDLIYRGVSNRLYRSILGTVKRLVTIHTLRYDDPSSFFSIPRIDDKRIDDKHVWKLPCISNYGLGGGCCMSAVYPLFDRQRLATRFRRNSGHCHKRRTNSRLLIREDIPAALILFT